MGETVAGFFGYATFGNPLRHQTLKRGFSFEGNSTFPFTP